MALGLGAVQGRWDFGDRIGAIARWGCCGLDASGFVAGTHLGAISAARFGRFDAGVRECSEAEGANGQESQKMVFHVKGYRPATRGRLRLVGLKGLEPVPSRSPHLKLAITS